MIPGSVHCSQSVRVDPGSDALELLPHTATKPPSISATLREELYGLSVDEASDKRTIGRLCGNVTCGR
ncbi:hypothetical protein MSS4_01981 [Mycobacterium marinum]|nr:hypothetical protein MSS4_01981 [Mycobacterium marinum]CDM77207.1 hypothetical protein MMARE11_30630 [Mycobacterium marinum E11]